MWLSLKKIEKLRAAKNSSDLAQLIGYKPKALSFILYKIPDQNKYNTFKIPKRGGGEREISAPIPHLKKLQQHLSGLLQDCFEEIYGREVYGRPLSHGFRRGQTIITNAVGHKNQCYVFNLDLKDFFPSINFGRVQRFFLKNHS